MRCYIFALKKKDNILHKTDSQFNNETINNSQQLALCNLSIANHNELLDILVE